ncbi:hypothetical protein GEMRC1_003542 [Eukaryota sp. GEM-RC1]
MELNSSQSTVDRLRSLTKTQEDTIMTLEERLSEELRSCSQNERDSESKMSDLTRSYDQSIREWKEKMIEQSKLIDELKNEARELRSDRDGLVSNFSHQVRNFYNYLKVCDGDSQVLENLMSSLKVKIGSYQRQFLTLCHKDSCQFCRNLNYSDLDISKTSICDLFSENPQDLVEDSLESFQDSHQPLPVSIEDAAEQSSPFVKQNSSIDSVMDRISLLSVTFTNVHRRANILKNLVYDSVDACSLPDSAKVKTKRSVASLCTDVADLKTLMADLKPELSLIIDKFDNTLTTSEDLLSHNEEMTTALTSTLETADSEQSRLSSMVEDQKAEISRLSQTIKTLEDRHCKELETSTVFVEKKYNESLKTAQSNEIYAKEITQLLKEEKQAAEEECQELMKKVITLEQRLQNVQSQNQSLQPLDDEVISLKQSRMKLEDEVKLISEELSVMKVENERLSSTLNQTRDELNSTRHGGNHQVNKLKEELNKTHTMYQNLKVELDHTRKVSHDLEIKSKSLEMTKSSLENDLKASEESKTQLLSRSLLREPAVSDSPPQEPTALTSMSRLLQSVSRKQMSASLIGARTSPMMKRRDDLISDEVSSTPMMSGKKKEEESIKSGLVGSVTPRSRILRRHLGFENS